jgi:hypothetical protein
VVDSIECYKVLDVEPGASADRVRQPYVELAQTWDPDRYVNNPLLHEQAAKKRGEIEEAYRAIRAFLPELQGQMPENEGSQVPIRDFKELERLPATESSKTLMGVLVAIVLFAVFAWAFYLLVKGHSVTPASPLPLD